MKFQRQELRQDEVSPVPAWFSKEEKALKERLKKDPMAAKRCGHRVFFDREDTRRCAICGHYMKKAE